MKRVTIGLIAVSIVISVLMLIPGCVTTSTYTKERYDQEISGNRGYIDGNAPPPEEKEHSTERTMLKIHVELPPYHAWEKYEWEDKDLSGNRGYLIGGPEVKE